MNIEIAKTLQAELQDIFAHDIKPVVDMNLELAIALTDEKRKRDKKLDAMKTWYETAKMAHGDTGRRIDGILERFAMSYYLETGSKTLTLPNGYRLSLRERPDKMEVVDEKATITWAKEWRPELVTEKYSVGTRALMEYFKETGEIPPGVEFKPGEGLSFSVKEGGKE